MEKNIQKQLEIVEKSNAWIRNSLEGNKQKDAYRNMVNCRRKLKRKKFALEGNPAAAMYGESQVGKSYLISSLLSEEGKPFSITDENGTHNFIEEINPPGGGSESTSLVSRFSVNYKHNNKMNKSKFPWSIVLPIFLAVLFGIVCFLGASFLNINNEKVWGMSHTFGCFVIAAVITTLLGGTAIIAILLKRTSGNFKTCYIWEIIFLLLFVVFALFFTTRTSPFSHYFTVMARKAEIKPNLEKSITQAEKMFAAYESYAATREELYKNKLKSVAAAKNTNPSEYDDYGFKNNGVSDNKQIETMMFIVHADLFPTNYSDSMILMILMTNILINILFAGLF